MRLKERKESQTERAFPEVCPQTLILGKMNRIWAKKKKKKKNAMK